MVWLRPSLAAYSHSASVGSRPPRQAQYAAASCQDTWTTGCAPRFAAKTSLPGPCGDRQSLPFTGSHHSTPSTALSMAARRASLSSRWNTKDQPKRSLSVT